MPEPLFRNVDCIMLSVSDLEAALRFYRDALGQPLVWRSGNDAAGLRMGESELVLKTQGRTEVDIKVDSAIAAAERFVKAGGSVVAGSFDIKIGKCVIVKDPWGNELVLLDSTKGLLRTDAQGNVIA